MSGRRSLANSSCFDKEAPPFGRGASLILSKDSVESDWVEFEVRKAIEKAKNEKRDVLVPIALDDAWKTCNWPERLMQQIKEYYILDFSSWTDEKKFDEQYAKLLQGIKLYYANDKKISNLE